MVHKLGCVKIRDGRAKKCWEAGEGEGKGGNERKGGPWTYGGGGMELLFLIINREPCP